MTVKDKIASKKPENNKNELSTKKPENAFLGIVTPAISKEIDTNIDVKESYLIKIHNTDEFNDLNAFLTKHDGKPAIREAFIRIRALNNVSYLKHNYCFEISLDLSYVDFARTDCYKGKVIHKEFFDDVYKFMYWYENEYLVLKDISIIKHIPHASTLLPTPDLFVDDMTIPNYQMTDIGVDDLFKFIPGIEIKAKYSRLFCDVERYKDPNKEVMAKYGQGYIYTKTFDGIPIYRKDVVSGVDYNQLADEYYATHHALLNQTVKEELAKGKKVLILDLHSYSDKQARTVAKDLGYPDICIGINSDFNNEPLLRLIKRKIREHGLTYEVNYPYKGSIIPTEVESGEIKGEVFSIMLEVNKRLYL